MTAILDQTLTAAAGVVADIPAPVALFDPALRYVAASAAWAEEFGLAADNLALAGLRHEECGAVYGRAALALVLRHALAGETVERCPIAGADARGQAAAPAVLRARPYRNSNGDIVGALVALHRGASLPVAVVAEGAAGSESPIANRDRLVDRLRETLSDADPARRNVLVVAISLDNLRAVNNLHGAAVAADAIKIVGERLLSGTRTEIVAEEEGAPSRAGDLVAALAAGQFAIACAPPAPNLADAHGMADRLLRLVQGPIRVAEHTLRFDASLGFTLTGSAQRDADDLLRDLDVALQRAQKSGPGKAIAWEPALTRAATRRYTLGEELRRAFDNSEFTLHYQPVVRLRDERMVGAEALLRWNHPRDGLMPSAAFVPALDETGLIVEVGAWAVREAVRQLESWRTLYGRDIVEWLSLNLAARQLDNPSVLVGALRAIHDGAFPVHRLRLEAAGAALVADREPARAAVEELQALGVRFAIDDFGIGDLSLDVLGDEAVDMVKLDAGFLAQLGTPNGEKLVEAVLDLTRARGTTAVAKGVETAAQRDFLRGAGCGYAQGFLFGQPMDGAQLGAYALTHSATHSAAPPPGFARICDSAEKAAAAARRRSAVPGAVVSLPTSADWSGAA